MLWHCLLSQRLLRDCLSTRTFHLHTAGVTNLPMTTLAKSQPILWSCYTRTWRPRCQTSRPLASFYLTTFLLNTRVKRDEASWTVEEANRMTMQVTVTLEPKSLTIHSFLTTFLLSMLTTRLKKYNKLLVKKST